MQQQREQWDYVIHILTENNKMLELEGRREGTSNSIEAFAADAAARMEGTVHRVSMRMVVPDSPPAPAKPHIRNVPALPSPETTVAKAVTQVTATVVKEEKVTTVPDGFISIEPLRFALPLSFPIKEEH